jgi:predicted AlkP superfamily pyrophosphatase or phosphodiesterase
VVFLIKIFIFDIQNTLFNEKFYSIIFLSLLIFTSCNQEKTTSKKPKLVIGIVIDQMRYDYLSRFADKYGEDGFKRIINNGFSLENANTITGIAPTIANLLQIEFPNGVTGEIVGEALKE